MPKRFDADVKKWIGQAKINIRLATRRIAFMLHDRIVERTPVDTGRARASWNIVAGQEPDLSVAPKPEKGHKVSPGLLETAEKQAAVPIADSYLISNNLPYIEPLENGHSRQAPVGMIRLAIADVKTRIEIELGGLKNG